MALSPGSRLGGFEIVGVIGAGGMGVVYRARDLKLKREVALKVLPSEFAADDVRMQRFQREAQAVAALNHPNVVTLYAVEESDGIHFLVMELIDGPSLVNMIPPAGLPLAQVLRYALPIADAMVAAHQQSIVHRDLKPANVMIRSDGRVKVLDFGLAKVAPGITEHSDGTTELLTDSMNVVGTTGYMSPEQAEGKIVDARSDIFSFGVMLYEMASGTRPFKGDSSLAILTSILRDDPPPLTQVKRELPFDYERIVGRCLAKDPTRRYQTALDVRTELDELLKDLSSGSTSRRAMAAPPPKRRSWLVPVSAAAIVLTIGGAAWRFRPGDPGPAPVPVNFQQVTSQPGGEMFARISPDGLWVIYTGNGEGNRDIYLQRVGGQLPINLTADSPADDEQPAFSPDGERIVFRSSRDGGGLFVMGRTGEAVRRFSKEGFNPDWSPDGKRVAYTTSRTELRPQNGEQRGKLMVVDIDGGEPREIAGGAMMPRWSPDGSRIVFAGHMGGRPDGSSNIVTVPAAGGPLIPITNDNFLNWNAIWAPDGKAVFFISNRSGIPNIWRVAVDQRTGDVHGEPEAITTPAGQVAHLSVSADGRQVAYSAVQESQNIEMVPFDPDKAEIVGQPKPVTTGSRFWANPDPSPDGTQVVFYSQISPEGDLYIGRADGSGSLRQLTEDPAIDRVPRWSPDGQWIATFSDRSKELQVWMIRPDGSDLRQVTTVRSAIVAWSPDSRRMAISRELHGAIIDPHGDVERSAQELKIAADQRFVPNSWSPDGKRLAGMPTFQTFGIGVFALDTTTLEFQTNFGEYPVWLPDSRRVLFVTRGREYHILDTRTKVATRIWSSLRDTLGPPRLTRDGRALFYQRRVTESDVWVATLR